MTAGPPPDDRVPPMIALPSMLSPDDFPDRKSLVRHLSRVCGWTTDKLATFFGLSARTIERDAASPPTTAAPQLTDDEAEELLRVYKDIPEAAAWIAANRPRR